VRVQDNDEEGLGAPLAGKAGSKRISEKRNQLEKTILPNSDADKKRGTDEGQKG